MLNHSSASRSSLADRIVNSLKAKCPKYHLTATKKIKKQIKKPLQRKQSKSSDEIFQNFQNDEKNGDFPWYRDLQGKTKFVQFTLSHNPTEKKKYFSEMVKQITERFRVKSDSKTQFSQCFYDNENELIYLGNFVNDDNKFLIGKVKSAKNLEAESRNNLINGEELKTIYAANNISFLFN